MAIKAIQRHLSSCILGQRKGDKELNI